MNQIRVICPYWLHGTWVFDDERVGLVQEPFVSGIPEMIDDLVAHVPDARQGFRLLFASRPFPAAQRKLTRLRPEYEGWWYRADQPPIEGWLCPALFRYFDAAPAELFVGAEPLDRVAGVAGRVEYSSPFGLGDGVASSTESQLSFLREAIRLSLEKMEANEGGPFGAVIVRDSRIVGRGWNRVTSTNDPTAHAEVMAIRDACARLQTFSLAGCEIFSSCEPCPLCLAAIYWSRLDRIHYAATADDAAAAGFDDRSFYRELVKPANERSIPREQALRDEALAALHAWTRKADRIRY